MARVGKASALVTLDEEALRALAQAAETNDGVDMEAAGREVARCTRHVIEEFRRRSAPRGGAT